MKLQPCEQKRQESRGGGGDGGAWDYVISVAGRNKVQLCVDHNMKQLLRLKSPEQIVDQNHSGRRLRCCFSRNNSTGQTRTRSQSDPVLFSLKLHHINVTKTSSVVVVGIEIKLLFFHFQTLTPVFFPFVKTEFVTFFKLNLLWKRFLFFIFMKPC